jgi:hypothetical protein
VATRAACDGAGTATLRVVVTRLNAVPRFGGGGVVLGATLCPSAADDCAPEPVPATPPDCGLPSVPATTADCALAPVPATCALAADPPNKSARATAEPILTTLMDPTPSAGMSQADAISCSGAGPRPVDPHPALSHLTFAGTRRKSPPATMWPIVASLPAPDVSVTIAPTHMRYSCTLVLESWSTYDSDSSFCRCYYFIQ